jgi:hypothetical protein
VTSVVTGIFKKGYAVKSPLFSRPAMMIGVNPIFGTAMITLEGTTCARGNAYVCMQACKCGFACATVCTVQAAEFKAPPTDAQEWRKRYKA